MTHPGDARWNNPPPLFVNAIDLDSVASVEGFQLDDHPTPCAKVVCGSALVFGYIGTRARGEGRRRYQVVEPNSLDFDPTSSRTGRRSTSFGCVAGRGVVGLIDVPPLQ